MKHSRLWLVLALATAFGLFILLDLQQYLSLVWLRGQHETLLELYATRPGVTIAGYFLLYVLATALSVPGAVVFSLAGGALFGTLVGTLMVSFASSVGATLAFLCARHLLRENVSARYGHLLTRIDEGLAREGAFYLLSLRLVPLFPFFMINLLLGLTRMPTHTYYLVSQLGMLPATVLIVHAGTELAALESPAGILGPSLLATLTGLGLLPLLAAHSLSWLRSRRTLGTWRGHRPRRYDRNLIVIGAGAAGLVTSYLAAALKAKVTLVERDRMGGECLNYGCVPSKALIRTSRLLHEMREASQFGIASVHAEFDFAQVMARVHAVVAAIAPHDSPERYAALGVECLAGNARLLSPWEVEITAANGETQVLTTRSVVLATGSEPVVPELPGLAAMQPLTSDSLWNLTRLPLRLVVLGGGPMGCELAQCFARLGSQVVLLERAPRLLPREDAEAAALVREVLEREGVTVLTGHQALECTLRDARKVLVAEGPEAVIEIAFDEILCALGRRARTMDTGLETLGIEAGDSIETDAFLATRYPNIFVAGDAAGPWRFTPVAAHQAWHATVNALFGGLYQTRPDYRVLPRTLFTDPEVASVGHTEDTARAAGLEFEITRFPLADLDRAITEGETRGFVKVLTPPGRDRLLGVTIVGRHAGEMLGEFALAMRHGLGLRKILATIHAYPTFGEAAKQAAGAWQRAHAPQGVLRWLARYHTWRRG
ncbi:MAG: pyridine nucleotide-disulfide oxidoreductase [Gammaproteobacteria bacterium]|nr:pyridine nucleotide-disulfide oxidoreductase [Gammaproteobacteria bacterium]